MLSLAAVFVGAFLGGLARFGLRLVVPGHTATWAANLVGSTIAGFAITTPAPWQLALGVGFAGALSTWSTFAKELGEMIKARRHGEALRYAVSTAVLGIAAAWFGMRWGLRAFGG